MSRKIATLVGTGIIGGGGTPAPTVTRLLDDQFTDVVAAGAVNGSSSTPGPGTRYVRQDTSNKLYISEGRMKMNGIVSVGNDPRMDFGAFTRAQGLAFAFDVFCPNLIDALLFGWMTGTGTGTSKYLHSIYIHSGDGYINYFSVSTYTSISTDIAINTLRKFVLVLRASGCYVVQYSADLQTANLLHVASTGNTSTLYAGGANRVSAAITQFDNCAIGQLGGGWAADAYASSSVPVEITGTDKLWLDALFA